MIAILALFFATAFPSNSKTSWMRPESFHLAVGMNRAAAVNSGHIENIDTGIIDTK